MNYVVPDKQADAWRAITDTNGYRRRMSARRTNQGVLTYPGAVSDSPQHLALSRKLAEMSIPIKVDKYGVLGPEAVPSDFLQLLTVPGYGMNPISVPPVSNALIRSKLGLVDDFVNPRHKEIFARLVKFMFARSAPASVGVRREASTGAPDYVNDEIKKHDELRAAYANIERFLQLIKEDKFLELYTEFNAPIVSTTGERDQADRVEIRSDGTRVSKDREVNDELAARTGLRQGRRFAADKRVIKHGNVIRGHFAGRRRTVFGMSFVPNYVLATFCAAWRAVYLEDFAFTWKHRTPEHILSKIKRYKFLKGFDVKQFDQSVGSWLIDFFVKEIGNYVDLRVAKMIGLMFKAPYIVPYPWIHGTSEEEFNPLFGDSPFAASAFSMDVGLPSGISINPDFGKWAMTGQYLCLLDDYFGDVLEVGVDTILRGEHDRYGVLNMTDDCILCYNEEEFGTNFDEKGYTCKYFALDEEKPISFLGNVPYRDDKGELQLAPNIVSYLVNWLVPEQGIDHAKRRNFWAIGERERRLHYSTAPCYPQVNEMLQKTFHDEFGVYPTSLSAEAYEQQRKYTNLSSWDALVLQNPDLLHYKVDEKQLSPDVLKILVTSVPAEEAWPVVSRYTDKRYQVH